MGRVTFDNRDSGFSKCQTSRGPCPLSYALVQRPRVQLLLLPVLWLFLVSCFQATPTIKLSRDKVEDRGHVTMSGTGFSPKANVISHLKRPDGTEFPGLRLLTDDKGEFTHVIDTYLFLDGTYELWVEEVGRGRKSNVVRFEVARS